MMVLLMALCILGVKVVRDTGDNTVRPTVAFNKRALTLLENSKALCSALSLVVDDTIRHKEMMMNF